MENYRVETLHLFGQDALEFARALYSPTKEEIEERKAIIEKINSNITITNRSESGFEAEVNDLDLSFLDY